MKDRRSLYRSRMAVALTGLLVVACAWAAQQTRQSAATGAGWGALAGLVFGGSLGDVVEGAVAGGVAGAVVGSAKAQEQHAIEQTRIARAREIREQHRTSYEAEAQRRAIAQAEYEQRIRMEREKWELERATAAANEAAARSQAAARNTPADTWMDDTEMLQRAFGVDTVTGLYALRECKHDYALIAATAGENSSVVTHQLAAVWLRSIIALDRDRTNSANAAFRDLVEIDPEVDTVDDARELARDLLVDIRADRKSAGIVCAT